MILHTNWPQLKYYNYVNNYDIQFSFRVNKNKKSTFARAFQSTEILGSFKLKTTSNNPFH